MRLCSGCEVVKTPDQFYGKHGRCRECIKARSRAWYAANKDRAIANVVAYVAANPEKISAAKRAWARRNTTRVALAHKAYRQRFPERRATSKKKWYEANRGAYAKYVMDRNAAKLQATPAWANQFFIEEAYRLAHLRSKVLGYKWHVDHIVPLKSKIVCGLHVEHNLQVIPAIHNLVKHNKVWPDMP